jgi:transketolase
LKKDDIVQLKTKFGFNPEESFAVPSETYDLYHKVAEKGAKIEAEWNDLFKAYSDKYPTEAAELQRRIDGRLPEGWEKALPTYTTSDPAVGSRKLSETTISKLAEILPELVGGSADLTGSNLTRWKGAEDFQHPSTGLGSYKGRYFRFGVREHGMTAICNGLAAYGGIIPFGATFLNFVSYAAGAVRLSALSHLRVLNVATHDSIGLGEDGPTHQPVETAAWLRAVPNLAFWRPADGNEVTSFL